MCGERPLCRSGNRQTALNAGHRNATEGVPYCALWLRLQRPNPLRKQLDGRWVTVATAASLIAGFGLGQIVPLRNVIIKQQAATPNAHFSAPVTVDRARELTPASSSPNDDELLSDAFASPKVKNLSALDDMTPHARDYISPRVRAPK